MFLAAESFSEEIGSIIAGLRDTYVRLLLDKLRSKLLERLSNAWLDVALLWL